MIMNDNKKIPKMSNSEKTEQNCSDRYTLYSDSGRVMSVGHYISYHSSDFNNYYTCVKIGVTQMTVLPFLEIVDIFRSTNNGNNKEILDYFFSGVMLAPRIAGDVAFGAGNIAFQTIGFGIIVCAGTFQTINKMLINPNLK